MDYIQLDGYIILVPWVEDSRLNINRYTQRKTNLINHKTAVDRQTIFRLQYPYYQRKAKNWIYLDLQFNSSFRTGNSPISQKIINFPENF